MCGIIVGNKKENIFYQKMLTMKKLLFGSMLFMLVAAYASNKDSKSPLAFAQSHWNNISDTVPQDTSDTTHKPDSLFLANFLAKN